MWNDHGIEIIDDRLNHWIPLLEKWCESFERFCTYSRTVPALNKEETHVGILSGASWDLGWVGFQEMRINRRISEYKREKFADCCDLYICDQTRIFGDYIECKKERIRNDVKDINVIKDRMTEACCQAENIILDDEPEKTRRIGVVFADFEFPYLPNQNIDDSIQRRFKSVKTGMELGAIAWNFPRLIRTSGDPNPNPKIILPGTMLLAKFVGYKTVAR